MAVAVDMKKGETHKKGFAGFSWTTFFFSFFVPLFRGNFKWSFIIFGTEFLVQFCVLAFVKIVSHVSRTAIADPNVLNNVVMLVNLLPTIAALITKTVFALKYNKIYTKNLIKDGFEPVNDSDVTTLKMAGVYDE